MQLEPVLLGVLLVVAIAACAVAIWALVEAARAARSVRDLSQDVNIRIVPLLDKTDVTVDAVNAELLRVDAIVTRIEGITDRVESTTRTVQEVASAPGEIVNDIAERVRTAWKRRQAETAASREARGGEAADTSETGSSQTEGGEDDGSAV